MALCGLGEVVYEADGDISVDDVAEVGAFFGVFVVDAFDHQADAAPGQFLDFVIVVFVEHSAGDGAVFQDAPTLGEGAAGEVYIQDPAGTGFPGDQFFENGEQPGVGDFVSGNGFFREGNGRISLKGALGGSPGCGRVLDVGGGILAVVDAGEDELRLLGHDVQTADADAVAGGSAAGEGVDAFHGKVMGIDIDGAVECDAVRGGAPLPVRGDHPDFAEFPGCRRQADQAVGQYAVVICNQDSFHGALFLPSAAGVHFTEQ